MIDKVTIEDLNRNIIYRPSDGSPLEYGIITGFDSRSVFIVTKDEVTRLTTHRVVVRSQVEFREHGRVIEDIETGKSAPRGVGSSRD